MILYIKHIAPKEEFQNLIDSLVRHMGNSILTINSRTVCQHGCITHLLDVPVGIDHSLAMFLNREQIEAEVIAVASWTSEIIESRLARPVKLPDAAQGWDNLGESDEEETEAANSFSQLKRGIMVTAVEKWLCDWGGLTLEQVQPFILSKLPEDGFY